MKVAAALASAASILVPAVALACPGACGACSAPSWTGYANALGIGVLVGIGSVSLEKMWRSRRDRGDRNGG